MKGCDAVRDRLPGAVDEGLDQAALHHVSSCLRCQAELAQYRRLGRLLRSLESQYALFPLGLHAAIMRAMVDAQGRASMLRRGALIVAGGVVVAAGTTAGILLSRHHRHRLAG